MDKQKLILLQTDINAQLQLIKAIDDKLAIRAEGVNPDDAIRLESIAYQIHNLYSATEDLLKIVAACFENNIADTRQWHTALLNRMTVPILGIRPAFISSETCALLNGLRGFRHFFRHAYGTNIGLFGLCDAMDGGYKGWNPYIERHLAIFVNSFRSRAN
jgi:hypothetical protein